MFGQIASQEIDVNNIKISLSHISDFIVNRELKNNRENNISFLKGFDQVAFNFVSSIFKGGWNQLRTDNNRTFHKLIKNEFTTKVSTPNKGKKTNISLSSKLVNFSKLPLLQLLLRPSKFHRNNTPSKVRKIVETSKLSYTQILSKNIGTILKIKENFLELSNKKIKQINKSIFNISDKLKPRINMTTKGPSRKQIIVPMSSNNANKIMVASGEHIAVKIVDGGLDFYFSLFILFYFSFLFFFSFSIFRTTQVRGYQSRCHISHKLMA